MSWDPLLMAVLVVIFTASLVKSTFGFGEALVGMPLLSLFLGVTTASPLISLVSLTGSVVVLAEEWRNMQVRQAWRLILPSLLGIPIGVFWLTRIPEGTVKGLLAVLVLGFALFGLLRPNVFVLRTDRSAFLFGFVAGILGGAYNTQGPPIVVYGTLRRWPAEEFRLTLQSIFFPTNLMVLVTHGLSGLWTRQVLGLYVLAAPVAIVAVLIGARLNVVVRDRGFARWVYVLLVGVGVTLLISALTSRP